jgi:hypothetical protein
VDVGSADPKGGLRERLYDEQRGSLVAFLFCHVDGVERTIGDPGVGSASALAAPRSWLGEQTREQWANEFSGAVQGFFSERKLSALAPMAVMHVGVVMLLGAWLWSSSLLCGSL